MSAGGTLPPKERRKLTNAWVKEYQDNRDTPRAWMNEVHTRLMDMSVLDPQSRIHSLRFRMKNEEHLRSKIDRKLRDSEWTRKHRRYLRGDGFWHAVTDLAGVRILVLYKHDIDWVNDRIVESGHWRVVEKRAYYDETRPQDCAWFRRLGLGVAKSRFGYTSVHYLLRAIERNPKKTCELQLRSVSQEGWAEFDHELRYPSGELDELARGLVRRVSSLVQVTEDIAETIRRTPTEGCVHREMAAAAAHSRGDRDRVKRGLAGVARLVDRSYTLLRQAPFAVIRLLNPRGTLAVPQRSITSLDFGPRSLWASDPIHQLYLDAHVSWLRAARPRRISKFFVWETDGDGRARQTPDILAKYAAANRRLHLYEVPEALFNLIHATLDKHRAVSKSYLRRLPQTQFFAWDLKSGQPPKASVRLWGKRGVYGFYSSAQDPDLLSGVSWIADTTRGTKNEWTLDLNASALRDLTPYASVLETLARRKIIRRITDTHRSAGWNGQLHKHQRRKVDLVVQAVLRESAP
jgi:putative GTP pyrophosphokinase